MQVRRGQQGYDKLEKGLKDIGRKVLKVGWFPSAKYQDGTSVASVAAQNEYGHGHIPARPFMRPTITAKQEEWKKAIEQGGRAILNGTITAQEVMEQVGGLVAGEIAEAITLVTQPPLAEFTIQKRREKIAKGTLTLGSYLEKPLVETGHLFNTLQHVIEDV